jgi:hypothetical protein
MGFQQLGRPVGNPPYHPDGPPWLAGSGLHRWYTYLVYPQQGSKHGNQQHNYRSNPIGINPKEVMVDL